MPILVDYVCSTCGARSERWSASPPAAETPCPRCAAPSRRAFAPVGLSGRAREATPSPASPARAGRSICSQYPQVPGLCHMSESAGRMWVAKYLRDGRAIDREAELQERAAAVRPPTMADAISHHHAHPAPATSPAAPPAAAG